MSWSSTEVRNVLLEDFDERLRRYRLLTPSDQRQMVTSLRREGQISPVVACLREEEIVLIDGFKRLAAARAMRGFASLSTRLIEADEQQAKAAMYRLNLVGRAPRELEEAWIVQALVHDDGLSQAAVASLLGRHKSWVCRRLALLEKLCDEARHDLEVGLLTPTQGRQLVRLPRGNQAEALQAARRDALSSRELQGVVDLLLASGTPEKKRFVLEKPRQAIRQAADHPGVAWDPRLSSAGNRVNRQLSRVLDGLASMETWFTQRARSELAAGDFRVLREPLERLVRHSHTVAERGEDFLQEMDST